MIKFYNKIEETWIDENIKNLKVSKNVAVAYPNNYKVASSNLGFHIIFKSLCLIGQRPARFFYDKYSNDFLSIDSEKKFNQFDFIFISISFENDLENIINFFKKDLNKNILQNNQVVIGGSAVNLNPFIFLNYSNKLGLGDCEEFFKDFTQLNNLKFLDTSSIKKEFEIEGSKSKVNENLIKNKKQLLNITLEEKNKINQQLKRIKEKYYQISNSKIPVFSTFISKNSSFPNYFLIEISRGCPFKCSFCSLGNLYENYKLFDLEEILNKLTNAYNYTKNFGLISAVVPPFSFINKIISRFPDVSLHFSSLRIDSINEDFISLIPKLGLKTITIAPETAIDDLRISIGKRFTNNDICEFIIDCIKQGVFKFKLYFIIGLKAMNPIYNIEQKELEIFEESNSILNLIDEIQFKSKERIKKIPFLSLSINPLIPKPLVPLFSYDFIGYDIYIKMKDYFTKEIYKRKNVEVEFLSYNEAKNEYYFSWNYLLEK